ncbi:hypothetical protein QR680_006095 [Steinernema hermaphroditum]|uniref:G-protein coupled receptors family 1 profile domain-containing protein n=1 Tax=Steinernema hermaphroditum TaxID=289476 RepID=A0AA39LWI4_9BILA|nr:hypothetical protein QR680_006095 [Steinernema hermaphroditum]
MVIIEIIFAIFSGISQLAQIVLVIVILRHKELRSGSFYILNVALACTDIGTILSHYLFQRFPQMGILIDEFYLHSGSHSVYAEICTNGFSFFKALQKYFLVAIGVNRFMAIVLPHIYEWWTPRNTVTVIFAVALISALPHAVIAFITRSYYMPNGNGGLQCLMDSTEVFAIHMDYMIYQPAFAAVVLLTMNAAIFVVLINNRKKIKASQQDNLKRHLVEIKLVLVVAVHVVLLLADCVVGIYTFLKMRPEMMMFIFIIQDVLCGCNPYLLLLFSSDIRRRVFGFMKAFKV